MKFIAFFFREGSSVLYSIYLALFALTDICFFCLNGGAYSMFIVALIGLGYLCLQNAMAAFSLVGNDRPLFDFFFSLLPLFTLAMIAVLSVVGSIHLSSFETLSLWLAAIVCLIDVVFNTQVIFKMNRLATDMVQMK
ncbi:MAG: hypothetical protein CME88_01225 [Hirschia sp.]|nr:hypothetical protein [Hirschia sp.]MBF16982.1 hypothetical protein [Hirschia sp.]|tara:strand:+ start:996 stop:1406 length:411 start_codon:yes stop_codon:yes gene_type:complete